MSEELFVRPRLDADGLTRRDFLQAIGAGVGAGVLASGVFGGLGGLDPVGAASLAEAAGLQVTPIGANDGVLVLVTLYGGNDGLNTVVPFTNGTYYDVRPDFAIAPTACLPLDDTYGLHPALPTIHGLWSQGRVALVHGVGYNPPNRSHFASMANWMAGRHGPINYSTGWIGRWLDGLDPVAAELAVAEVGVSLPLHLKGARTDRAAVAIPISPILIRPPAGSRLRAGLTAMHTGAATERGPWGDAIAKVTANTIGLADDIATSYPATPLETGFVGSMTMAARLINADVGLRVISVALEGFDTHAGQPDVHASLMAQLDAGVAQLLATLQPAWSNRVTVATLSEFGRSPHSNASAGTDHGTSNVHLVIGPNIAGGHHGLAPRLGNLDANRQLIANLDYRTFYANLVSGWLGGDGGGVVGGTAESLDLFAAAPGMPPPPPTPAAPPSSGFVPLAPVRMFDTRDGTGGRLAQIAANEVWTTQLNGIDDVPGEARAIVLNLTATGATDPTFVTAWNAGAPWPGSSNLNPLPGQAVPNLVIGRVGHAGEVAFTVGHGAVDLIGDLVGYFDDSALDGLMPLDPYRLLDTRITGTRLGPGQSLDLVVTGVGGVPGDAVGVALNLTAVNPTDHSFLTMWPTGEEMPLASSLNMRPGQTIPNLAFSSIGAGGKVSIYNLNGTTDVLVDVLGCFRPAGAAFVAVTPSRLLDTRIGVGAPVARVSGDVALQVAGVSGVPANAVAALLNVTAVLPSQPTFVTVYPAGTTRPEASNLNVLPGEVVPNMVVARLGPGGAANLYNAHGNVDLLADLVGYFVP